MVKSPEASDDFVCFCGNGGFTSSYRFSNTG